MAMNTYYPQAPNPQQYHSHTPANLQTIQIPPPPPCPPPGPPPSSLGQPWASPLSTTSSMTTPESPPQNMNPSTMGGQSHQPGHGYANEKPHWQTPTYYPPPPNAPPTPQSTHTSYSPSVCASPPARWPAQPNSQQPMNCGQPTFYPPGNAPPTPAYSPTSVAGSRPQSIYQVPLSVPPTPQYTPQYVQPAYVPAGNDYGTSTPHVPIRTQSSYFPPQAQPPQPTQVQQPVEVQSECFELESPAFQPAATSSESSHASGTASPLATEMIESDLFRLSLQDKEPLCQEANPKEQGTPPSSTQPLQTEASQEKAQLQQAYTQPLGPGTNAQARQGSYTHAPVSQSPPVQPQQTGASQEKAQLRQQMYFPPPPSSAYNQRPQLMPSRPVSIVQSLPPPPYSPSAQPMQTMYPPQQVYPQQQTPYLVNGQQPQTQYQQQQTQQQAQTLVQQQSPYQIVGQQPQMTQMQVQSPVMGLQQPQYAQAQVQQVFQTPQVQSIYEKQAPPGILAHKPGKDDVETGKVTRFLGDTLVGRFARSSVSTVTTTIKMPAVLSPWGDNNPVTLPNVRYRDAALFGTFAVIGAPLVDGVSDAITSSFGADHFISEIVGHSAGFITGNTIVKYGVFQIVEQAIDKGVLEKVLPEVEKTMRTTTAKTLQVSIKHKLMGVEADIRMHGTYPAAKSMACDKGWFAPYLFASSRTPVIKRSEDFAIAQFFKPYLQADTLLTHKLLTESASVIPLCDPAPTARLAHARLLVGFIGIAPFRGEGSGMWSTSRRPGCGQLRIHLLNGCPTLVLPAVSDNARTPVIAWSPWTLKQMHSGANNTGLGEKGVYSPQKQHTELCGYLLELVDRSGLHPSVTAPGTLERVLGKVVTMIINGALTAPGGKKVCGVVDPERAGLVVMRY